MDFRFQIPELRRPGRNTCPQLRIDISTQLFPLGTACFDMLDGTRLFGFKLGILGSPFFLNRRLVAFDL